VSYTEFINRKRQSGSQSGFEPIWLPDSLFPFQRHCVEWAIRKGRCALLEDCGLGKTLQQLVWGENVVRHTNKPVLILTPLAVSQQTVREAQKFDIDARISQDGTVHPNITVTNYERLHYFDPNDFAGVVPDEASIMKSWSGATQKRVTRFLCKMPYRLAATATAAPNDYIELGTLSESLGELSFTEMRKRFFQQLDDKGQKKERKEQDQAERLLAADPNYFRKLAYRVAQTIGQWRLRHHAIIPFWRWVASWALACRMPSDLGFSDDGFILPPLNEVDHILKPATPPPGMLFSMPAFGMKEERAERKRTLRERCDFVANLVNHPDPAVIWCHGNEEADELERTIPGARQIAGRTPDGEKIELYEAFASRELLKLVIKPKLGAWGLNWQHCAHVVTFPSHSYEQYYQSVRRCWRFGQKKPVRLDVVATDGELRVLGNMRQKAEKAEIMFTALVAEMNQATRVEREDIYTNQMEAPAWL
jgi:superfamily II DNA or RNA helicase